MKGNRENEIELQFGGIIWTSKLFLVHIGAKKQNGDDFLEEPLNKVFAR